MTTPSDDLGLAGKVAIVTGGGAAGDGIGNGRAAAMLLARAGATGAVIALPRAMAVDHGRDRIRVNCVAPGPVYTPMVYAAGMSDEARNRRRTASALGIEGTGWDVGYAVRFLLSDHARYITGHTLV